MDLRQRTPTDFLSAPQLPCWHASGQRDRDGEKQLVSICCPLDAVLCVAIEPQQERAKLRSETKLTARYKCHQCCVGHAAAANVRESAHVQPEKSMFILAV